MIETDERPSLLGSDPKNESIDDNSWADITFIQEMPDYVESPRYRVHADIHGVFKRTFSIREMRWQTDFLVDTEKATRLVKTSSGLNVGATCETEGSLYEFQQGEQE